MKMKKFQILLVILIIVELILFIQCDEPVVNEYPIQSATKLHIVPQQYPTIQSAIDATEKGDTVLVSPGTYVENITFRSKNIVVKANGPVESVVIDGSQPTSLDEASVVRFVAAGESVIATLDGFTITGGKGSWSWPGKVGGGIWIENAQAVIKNCIIQNNSGTTKGGGVYCGYEMGTNLGSSQLLNCIITNNGAVAGGSGIHIKLFGSMDIDHCTIANNDVMLETTAQALTSFFSNCIIWPATINYTYGIPEFNYCDIQGGWSSGIGNIDEDPRFADVSQLDYRLASNSPCLGARENTTDIGALGSCAIEYYIFNYPLTIGTTWKYHYYYHKREASTVKRYGIHTWSIVDSIIVSNDLLSYRIESINMDTLVLAYGTDSVFSFINDTVNFFIDRGINEIVVRIPRYNHPLLEDHVRGYFRGDQLVQIGGRFYQEEIGLIRMYHYQHTNTLFIESQRLLEFNGIPIIP